MISDKRQYQSLKRKQLDSKLLPYNGLRTIDRPKSGWIRAIRSALGMSADQLGRRLGMSRQGVADLEKREAAETISLATLRKAADALGCDLVFALVPRDSLETIVRDQARRKARDDRGRLLHTMRLEQQEEGVEDALDVEESIESWLRRRSRKLWD